MVQRIRFAAKGVQESQTEKKDMRQQRRMKVITDMTRKSSQSAEWTQTTVGGSVSCWPLVVKKRGSTHDGKTLWSKWLYEMKKEDE